MKKMKKTALLIIIVFAITYIHLITALFQAPIHFWKHRHHHLISNTRWRSSQGSMILAYHDDFVMISTSVMSAPPVMMRHSYDENSIFDINDQSKVVFRYYILDKRIKLVSTITNHTEVLREMQQFGWYRGENRDDDNLDNLGCQSKVIVITSRHRGALFDMNEFNPVGVWVAVDQTDLNFLKGFEKYNCSFVRM